VNDLQWLASARVNTTAILTIQSEEHSGLTFAHRFLAAFAIAGLPAAERTRCFAPFTSTAAEWLSVCAVYRALVR